MQIRAFQPDEEDSLIALWQTCGLVRPWNDPRRDIRRKLRVDPELLLVGLLDDNLVASVMAGYDGHRGWLYYLAVAPDCRRHGLGRAIVTEAERLLRARGCPKINLQVRAANAQVIEFYRRLGFSIDEVFSMGRRLIDDRG